MRTALRWASRQYAAGISSQIDREIKSDPARKHGVDALRMPTAAKDALRFNDGHREGPESDASDAKSSSDSKSTKKLVKPHRRQREDNPNEVRY
jgi:hypothetical protein